MSDLDGQGNELTDDLTAVLSFHLARVPEARLQMIRQHFGSLQAAASAPESAWHATNLLTPKMQEKLFADDLAQRIEQAMEWGEQPNQTLLHPEHPDYPPLLKAIEDAPPLLYVRGRVSLLSEPQLAIVGSRHASKQGVQTAMDFAQHLAGMGLSITSGLASGIDKAAHEGALKTGETVAVVATGLDRVYPAANKQLAHQIAEQGAMVSEFPLGTKPIAAYFPQRNRIISGLSVGTLVVEAALKSGSLITARTAIEQGREVFAVPGSIHNPLAKGCHQLIRQGAKLVESGQHVLEELAPLLNLALQQLDGTEQNAQLSLPTSDYKLLEFIEYEPIGLDELAVISKMPVSEIQAQLMLLELEGQIEAMSAGRWRRIS